MQLNSETLSDSFVPETLKMFTKDRLTTPGFSLCSGRFGSRQLGHIQYESVEMKRCERRKRTLVLSKLTSSDAITVGAKRRPLFAPLIWSGLYLCGQVMCVCVKSGRPFEAALVVHLMLSRKRLPVHRMSSSRCSHNSRGCVSGRARSTCLDRKRSGGGGMFQLEVGKLLM